MVVCYSVKVALIIDINIKLCRLAHHVQSMIRLTSNNIIDLLNCVTIWYKQSMVLKTRFPLLQEDSCVNHKTSSSWHGLFVPIRMVNYIHVGEFQVPEPIHILITRDLCDSVYRKSCKLILVAASNWKFAVVHW